MGSGQLFRLVHLACSGKLNLLHVDARPRLMSDQRQNEELGLQCPFSALAPLLLAPLKNIEESD